jgi:hypothetical protein
MTSSPAIISLLAGVLACQSDTRTGINPEHGSAAVQSPAPRLNYQLVYKVGPAPDCSNWYAALRKARTWAGCDRIDATQASLPLNPCQQRVQGCDRGCDICPILGTGLGPPAEFEDLGPLRLKGNLVRGKRGTQSIGRSYSTFNTRLCEDIVWVDVLGSTIIHEAMHHCHGGYGISDFVSNQPGCSASALELFCTGITSGEGN